MQNGMTPLHLAVWYSITSKDISTVKTLLDNNADCSAKDNVHPTLLKIIASFVFFISTTMISCTKLCEFCIIPGRDDSFGPSTTRTRQREVA